MLALLDSLTSNAETIREIKVDDNWIKASAAEKLCELVLKAKNLERLNISDSNMGSEGVLLVLRGIKESKANETLK